jgi:hypothetical protein
MLRPTLRRGALPLGAALAVAAGFSALARTSAIAPGGTGAELVRQPGQNWVTDGGNVFNRRCSSRGQFIREGVAEGDAVWRWRL